MTPKEKAKELFDKFYSAIPNDEMGKNYESAKQCALIAVYEILSICPLPNRDYYEEIKKELQNLS